MRSWVNNAMDGMSVKKMEEFERAVVAVENWYGQDFTINSIWIRGYPASYGMLKLAIAWLYDLGKLDCLHKAATTTWDLRCLRWRWKNLEAVTVAGDADTHSSA